MMNSMSEPSTHILVVAAFLSVLLIYFIGGFVLPAHRVRRRLNLVVERVAGLPKQERLDLSPVFRDDPALRHPWEEFRETLHEIRTINPTTGVEEVSALRATLQADVFFTDDVLIDHHVKTEFFKHLPGIFTGIGIIGTFTGLLVGLSKFGVSDDADAARESLQSLLSAVSEAFVVSAAAILLAMVVTFFEKQILVGLYARARALTQAIDERFKAGVGEEYLARLVGASEQSATHSAQLKDAMVGELKTILIEISDRQIAAFSESQAQLGKHISDSVASTLKQPLEKLATATESVRGDQGQAVQQLITDLLAQFTSKVESLFGGQMTGMQQMQQQTIEALREAVGQLRQMSETVEGAGQRASEMLMEKLNETLRKLNQRQLVMTEEMKKFIQEIRGLIGQTQTETHEQTKNLLEDLATRVGAAVGALSSQSQSAVGAMGTQIADLSTRVGEAITQMSAAVVKLEGVTTDAVLRMNSGAETLAIAADDFARAGQGVAGALSQAQVLTSQLTQSTQALASASNALESLLADYRATRDVVAQMLVTVRTTVESAKREASLTEDVVRRLEASAIKLASAQTEADSYLEKVTEVLGTAHQAFADVITRSLNAGNREFVDAMSRATKLLGETIQELEGALGNAVPRAAAVGRR